MNRAALPLLFALTTAGCTSAPAGLDASAPTTDARVSDDSHVANDSPPSPTDSSVDALLDAAAPLPDVAPPPDASPADSGPRMGACSPAIAPTAGVQTARPKGSTCAALGYYEYVPAGYASRSDWPLILEFHGDGQRGNGASELPMLLGDGLPALIASDHWDPAHRFVVLSPQMDDRNGMTERTGPSVQAFIAFALANYNVDPRRIYLTGYSGGAEPIYNYLGNTATPLVAAVLPISGWYSTQDRECTWRQVPIWYFHGAMDNTVPAPAHSTASYNNLVMCSPAAPVAPRYTLFSGRGHDDWPLVYNLTGRDAAMFPTVTAAPGNTPYDQSIYDWFLRYSR